MVLRVEIIHGEANPAGDQDQDDGDDLAHEGDGLLDDVEDREDREDNADDVDDGTHGFGSFIKWLNVHFPKNTKNNRKSKHIFPIFAGLKPAVSYE